MGKSKETELILMDKSATISDWLRSGEYCAEIDSVHTKITRGCDNSDNICAILGIEYVTSM